MKETTLKPEEKPTIWPVMGHNKNIIQVAPLETLYRDTPRNRNRI